MRDPVDVKTEAPIDEVASAEDVEEADEAAISESED